MTMLNHHGNWGCQSPFYTWVWVKIVVAQLLDGSSPRSPRSRAWRQAVARCPENNIDPDQPLILPEEIPGEKHSGISAVWSNGILVGGDWLMVLNISENMDLIDLYSWLVLRNQEFYDFPIILGISSIPTDELRFFRGVAVLWINMPCSKNFGHPFTMLRINMNTVFRNIPLPAILGFIKGTRFWPIICFEGGNRWKKMDQPVDDCPVHQVWLPEDTSKSSKIGRFEWGTCFFCSWTWKIAERRWWFFKHKKFWLTFGYALEEDVWLRVSLCLH